MLVMLLLVLLSWLVLLPGLCYCWCCVIAGVGLFVFLEWESDYQKGYQLYKLFYTVGCNVSSS